jgi:hypothetical protein
MRLSKKKRRELEFISVADDVIREYHTSDLYNQPHCFIDDRPDWWDKEHKEIYDMAHDIEDKLKAAMIAVLESPPTPTRPEDRENDL